MPKQTEKAVKIHKNTVFDTLSEGSNFASRKNKNRTNMKKTKFSNRFLTAGTALLMCGVMTAQNGNENNIPSEYTGWNKYRIGGYGEMLGSFMNYGPNRMATSAGSIDDNRSTISIPRFVIAGDYKFSDKWILGAEIEFEAGGVGAAKEIDWMDENGEYETETEKGGEVALEQFHITRLINKHINIRIGHMVLPIGLVNAHHEPINFFGTSRPEAETAFIPSTWHETGLALFGSFFRNRVNYEAMVVAGLNCDGFARADWVSGGKQGAFETDAFSSPAYVGRLDFNLVKGLRFGGSVYYCANTAANADKTQRYSDFKVPVFIWSADAQYKGYGLTARASCLFGNIGNTDKLAQARKNLPNASGYSVKYTSAKSAASWGGEIGYDLCYAIPSLKGKAVAGLYPFVRYEYFNPVEDVEEGQTKYDQFKVSKWTFGANWYALPNLAIKADYAMRRIGGGKYNNENEFSIGIAYITWFAKK